jgi:alkylation response protein AidB-like acyl-CoA dehydrogenase
MNAYAPPLDDVRFILESVVDYPDAIAVLPGLEEAQLDLVMDVLTEAGTFCVDELLPLNRSGDEEGCTLASGAVSTPAGFRAAYGRLAAGGWTALACEREHGGAGLPHLAKACFHEMMAATNLGFLTYTALGHGAYDALLRHGSDDQRSRLLPPLVSGVSTGTMCLTEAHAGTDLGLIRTRAVPSDDGSYRISGQKIFITAGDHDLTDDIVHLVLAKLPGAPAGTRGISMFVVPKRLPDGSRNGVTCTALEHKMGIRSSATCALEFEDARGELVGEPHRGMRAMFTMMNGARLDVGLQGLGLAEAAYQLAADYARERLQGRSPAGASRPDLSADPIIVHPEVRRVLLRIRTQVEAGRALGLWVASELDVADRHPDPARREQAGDFVALMTPIVKAGLSDLAWEATSLALGVFGGHGYIRDSGVEQLVRDARITQIYEGTNDIQALDLAGRKLGEGSGRLLRRFFHPVSERLAAAVADPELEGLATPAHDALELLRQATLAIYARAQDDREEAAAAARDYLRLFQLTAFAYLWVVMAAAAQSRSDLDDDFRAAKLAGARYFMARVLPETAGLAAAIAAGKATLMDPAAL